MAPLKRLSEELWIKAKGCAKVAGWKWKGGWKRWGLVSVRAMHMHEAHAFSYHVCRAAVITAEQRSSVRPDVAGAGAVRAEPCRKTTGESGVNRNPIDLGGRVALGPSTVDGHRTGIRRGSDTVSCIVLRWPETALVAVDWAALVVRNFVAEVDAGARRKVAKHRVVEAAPNHTHDAQTSTSKPRHQDKCAQ